MKFTDLDLDPNVLKAVSEAGYTEPTPIQAEAIPEALKGRDVLGIAQTGTGKTASFTLPMISLLAQGRARARMPRSLILCPTRELAAQVAENFEIYGKYHKLTMALLIGGVSFKDQDKLIDRGVDVLIATPGRLLDHFERGKLMLTGVQVMVVDEADRMLDMGFIPDIERIFKLTPFTRQTLFFSATMPPEITRLTQEFLHNPVRVEVDKQATAAETVKQQVCIFKPSRRDRETASKEKRNTLRAMMTAEGEALKNAIIFCNRKTDVSIVDKSLRKHGYNAGALHGDLDQSVRMKTLNAFRDGEIKLLVASDVAARGLDIPNVSHVFNFDVPIHAEDYVHRIGRTGRAGREGTALTIAAPLDTKYLDRIEEMLGRPIDRMDTPEVEKAEPREGTRKPSRRSRKRDDDRPEGNLETKSAKPMKPTKAEPTPEASEPVTAMSPEVSDDAPIPAPKPVASKSSGRGNRSEKGGRRGKRDGDVIGMGSHVPAFLLRPVRPAEKAKAEEAPVEITEDSEASGAAA